MYITWKIEEGMKKITKFRITIGNVPGAWGSVVVKALRY